MSTGASVSVLILSQPSEGGVTALTLHHLLRDLGPHTRIHVLMNGGFTRELQAMFPSSDSVSFYSSPINRGVAGGRNFLLLLPEVQESEYVLILDNDVITPPGHIERLVGAIEDDPSAGVVGPAILYLPAVEGALGLDQDYRHPVLNESLVRLGRHMVEESAWFHLGTNPDWRAVYLDEVEIDRRLANRLGGSYPPFYSMNHEDPGVRSAVARRVAGPIPCSNVAGCCQIFRRSLIDDVGYLLDEFSPYGFEDVDFCIRVANAGYRNYVNPSIMMLHGTDGRHLGRKSPQSRIDVQRNLMRCKTLLAWRHDPMNWEASIENSILRRYLLARHAGHRSRAPDNFYAHLSGSADARRQIRHSSTLYSGAVP